MSKNISTTFWCDSESCPSRVDRVFEPDTDTMDTIPRNWLVDMSRQFHACSRRCQRRIDEQYLAAGYEKHLLWLTYKETA